MTRHNGFDAPLAIQGAMRSLRGEVVEWPAEAEAEAYARLAEELRRYAAALDSIAAALRQADAPASPAPDQED